MNKNNHKGKILETKNDFKIINCESCGFVHIDPIPSLEELEQIYKHEYYSKEKPSYIENYKKDKEWWDRIYKYRFNLFEELLNDKKGKILDIGSGPGYFLLEGLKRGWIAKGLEPNEDAANYSLNLGLDIEKKFFNEEVSKNLGEYDVINLGEVLEHLPNPENFIKNIKNNLNKNGILSIIVPNDFNPIQNILNKHLNFDPWWISPPHHINYFSFDSLTLLLEKLGFEILNKESTFPIDFFLLMDDNYILNNDLGRTCHTKRMIFEKNLLSGNDDLMRDLYKSFAKLNLGREIFITARIINNNK